MLEEKTRLGENQFYLCQILKKNNTNMHSVGLFVKQNSCDK